MGLQITKTAIPGVLLIHKPQFRDKRGYFSETYHQFKWAQLGVQFNPVQVNLSLSNLPGTIRGLHYQIAPYAQAKAVRVVTGAAYDVVVDLRQSSPTFGHWESFTLSETCGTTVIVPRGFAHGFCTLEPCTRLEYLVDNFYAPDAERGILFNDPDLNIPWPTENPILSDKDSQLPLLSAAEITF